VTEAEHIVSKLLETGEDVDWTPDPEDPDALTPAGAADAVEQGQARDFRAEFHKAFKNAFQKPEIEACDYFVVTTDGHETWVVPAFVHDPGPVPSEDFDDYTPEYDAYHEYLNGFEDYIEGDALSVERHTGFVYRTSAPGYLDSSPWCAAASEEEAMQDLIDNYGSDFDDAEEEEQL